MPRSRRRAGVKPGKTQTQLAKAHHHRRLMERRAAHAAKTKREAEARRARFDAAADKYANYPGNR